MGLYITEIFFHFLVVVVVVVVVVVFAFIVVIVLSERQASDVAEYRDAISRSKMFCINPLTVKLICSPHKTEKLPQFGREKSPKIAENYKKKLTWR